MSIKLAILKSGETIISDVKELVSEEKSCGYLLDNPYLVTIRKEKILVEVDNDENTNRGEIEVSLSPWIILSKDTQILLNLDYVATLVEPVDSLREMYEERMNDKDS
jgi:hypothetical protein